MIEDSAVTCTFGVRPRMVRPVGQDAFGTPRAIGPHFKLLPLAEAKAALAMMVERGYPAADMTEVCGITEADMARIRRSEPKPLAAPGGSDRAPGGRQAQPRVSRFHALNAVDLDRALALVAGLAFECGAGLDTRFSVSMHQLSIGMAMSLDATRHRVRGLEDAGLIDRRAPLGATPGSILVTALGRVRLERMGFDHAGFGDAPAGHRGPSSAGPASPRVPPQVDHKAVRMLAVLDRLRLNGGFAPGAGFPASVTTVSAAAALIDKTARNHLDLVIRQGLVAREASAGRCATLTITPAGRAVLDTLADDAPDTGEDA
ncbi:hypothetical protein LL06_00840 [Hoeflea sp. BAL378]|uniref:hypothetical protein n=1 Tax=Hoeflea sp. BAL378 TaxID=1547437 RepID=UPI0005147C70|nr:hypothetical protein [Hoeflea sp. BAL378]KGF71172.1 hypothetical protein LL06_00840 [Hoeflea sp. BAL378]